MRAGHDDHPSALTARQALPESEVDPTELRRAVIALAFGAFAVGVAEFTVTGLLNDIAASLHSSPALMGNAISAYALGVTIGAPAITILGANLRRKTLLLLIVGIFIVGNAAALVAFNFELFALARFVAGLPHGAYFGVAVATGVAMARADRRGRVSSHIVLGQTVANVLGVPAATLLGQALGWRSAFVMVVACGVLTLLAVIALVPDSDGGGEGRIRHGFAALHSRVLWVAVLIGAVGFAGMYSVLSYIAPISTGICGLVDSLVPIVMMFFGIGMTAGAVVGGRMADWDTGKSLAISFGLTAVALLAFTRVIAQPWAPFFVAVSIGFAMQIAVQSLQLRLVDAAPSAPAVGASLLQSAANVANVVGTSLGSVVIVSGAGYQGLGLQGAVLGAVGMLSVLAAYRHSNR